MSIRLAALAAAVVGLGLAGRAAFADNAKPTAISKTAEADTELAQKVIAARKEYQTALVALYEQYSKTGDKERMKWVEDELKGFHLTPKPAYRLDLVDVIPAGVEPRDNIKEANDLFRLAMEYKGKGFGTDYLLNQRRAEIVLHDIIQKYPKTDKISDVAYELGDLYESRAFRQYARAAAYFERACNWRKGSRTDARLRAARLYDKQLNERAKAIELYRDVVAHDTDPDRMKEAEKRLAELTGSRR
jgi:tetratricopeptide (TPR) repeat protein